MIDPDMIDSIKNIVLPHNKRAMQSFLCEINFVHRFIYDFAKTVKPLQDIIKKDEN